MSAPLNGANFSHQLLASMYLVSVVLAGGRPTHCNSLYAIVVDEWEIKGDVGFHDSSPVFNPILCS